MQTEFPFNDEPLPLAQFDAYKLKHPQAKTLLISAARLALKLLGQCSIYLAYDLAVIRYGLHCSRDWLPAYSREIAAECKDLRTIFKTRPSRFDGRPRA